MRRVYLAPRRAPARKLSALRADFFAGVRSFAPGLPALAGRFGLVLVGARSAENALIDGLLDVPSVAVLPCEALPATLRGAFLPWAASFLGVWGSLAFRVVRVTGAGAIPAATEYNPFLPGR